MSNSQIIQFLFLVVLNKVDIRPIRFNDLTAQ